MVHYRSLIVSFALIISLSTMLGVLALYQMLTIADNVDKIYRHPFAVSNAGQTIESRILAMHRDMKDVVLIKDENNIHPILLQIDQHEQAVLEQFNIIFERFLGSKSEISSTYQLFLEWRPIRNEVLTLHALGEHDAAIQITRERGAEHVQRLQSEVREFVNFAKSKAEEFHLQARREKQDSVIILSVLSVASFLLSTVIAILMVRAKRASEKNTAQQAHLIDQNIMIASLDLEGNITQVSNALCRFLQSNKDKLIGTQSHFFINIEDKNHSVAHIWRMIKTGKAWEGEIHRQNSDGVRSFAHSTILPVFNEHFDTIGYTNIIQDSTDKKLSVTDALTTLPNRRSFEQIFEQELQSAKREKTVFTLAVLDVDHFKLFNDNYGHQAGDVALSKVGKCLQESLNREGEYVFRIGGEEFAILLVEQGRELVNNLLEQVRHNIEHLRIVHEHNSASEFLTLSIGACMVDFAHLAAKSQIGVNSESLYMEADKALYLAKNNRNSVVINNFQVGVTTLHDRRENS